MQDLILSGMLPVHDKIQQTDEKVLMAKPTETPYNFYKNLDLQ